MIGVKMTALARYLQEHGNLASNTLDYSMENSKLVPLSNFLGNGYEIARCDYSAVFEIKDCTLEPEVLNALVACWLIEFDSTRKDDQLESADFDIDGVQGNKANIDFVIDFRESITMVEDPNGPILFRGNQYGVAAIPDIDMESIAVGNDHAIPTDFPVNTSDYS